MKKKTKKNLAEIPMAMVRLVRMFNLINISASDGSEYWVVSFMLETDV